MDIKSVDEMIKELSEWRQKYPTIPLTGRKNNTLLNNIFGDNEVLYSKYDQMREYYGDLRKKFKKGKLTEKQKEDAKNGDLRGDFGYLPSTDELAKKYNRSPEEIQEILDEYDGSLDNVYERFINGDDKVIDDISLGRFDGILRYAVNVDSIDENDQGYAKIWGEKIIPVLRENRRVRLYSLTALKASIEEFFNSYEQYGYKDFIDAYNSYYGINCERLPFDDICKKYGYEDKNRKKFLRIKTNGTLWIQRRIGNFDRTSSIIVNCATPEEREEFQNIEKDIFLQNGDLSENLKKRDKVIQGILNRLRTVPIKDLYLIPNVKEVLEKKGIESFTDLYTTEEIFEEFNVYDSLSIQSAMENHARLANPEEPRNKLVKDVLREQKVLERLSKKEREFEMRQKRYQEGKNGGEYDED